MKSKLFQYAVLWHPKEKKANDQSATPDEKSKIITDLTTVLAPDERTVGMIAARGIPEEYVTALDQIEILVRPF